MIFICQMAYADTLRMWPCSRCKQLTYFDHDLDCDSTPQEAEETREEERDHNHPDADAEQVMQMLGATPWLVFGDPTELYEGKAEDDGWLQ